MARKWSFLGRQWNTFCPVAPVRGRIWIFWVTLFHNFRLSIQKCQKKFWAHGLRGVEGSTTLNNSPIDLCTNRPHFNGHFWGSGYIYCIFDTYGPLGNPLNFIRSFNLWGVTRIDFPLRARVERPLFFAPSESAKYRFARVILHRRYFHAKIKNPKLMHINPFYEARLFIWDQKHHPRCPLSYWNPHIYTTRFLVFTELLQYCTNRVVI